MQKYTHTILLSILGTLIHALIFILLVTFTTSTLLTFYDEHPALIIFIWLFSVFASNAVTNFVFLTFYQLVEPQSQEDYIDSSDEEGDE